MRGEAFANAEWRIANNLWKKARQPDEKSIVVEYFCRAVSESSRSEGEEFVMKWKAMSETIDKEGRDIKDRFLKGLNIKDNATIEYINLVKKDIGPEGCLHLVTAKWNNLNTLSLSNPEPHVGSNRIGPTGC